MSVAIKQPKKKGRPPKVPIDINTTTELINVNEHNIIPSSGIIRNISNVYAGEIDKKLYRLHLSTDKIDDFEKVVEVIKTVTNENVIMAFDDYGITFHKRSKDGLDNFNIKMFSDKMKTYHCKEKFAVKIDVGLIFKFLKNFKNQAPLFMYIFDKNDTQEIKFETINSELNVRRTYVLNYVDVDYSESLFSRNLSEDNYDIIVILNSEFFIKECKDLKGISQNFQIFCTNSSFEINVDNESIRYTGRQGVSKSIKYIKKLKDENGTVNIALSTVLVMDYIKCNAFSKIIKFYLTNDHSVPMTIEYDIGEGFGVFQGYLHLMNEYN